MSVGREIVQLRGLENIHLTAVVEEIDHAAVVALDRESEGEAKRPLLYRILPVFDHTRLPRAITNLGHHDSTLRWALAVSD